MLPALLLALLMHHTQAAPVAQLRVLREGTPAREVETASDAAYTKDVHKYRVAPTLPVFEAPALPAFARSRPLRPDGKPMGAWTGLSTRSWPPALIPARVKIPRSEAGKKVIQWEEPTDAPLGGLSYRARIYDASGNALADQLIHKSMFLVPSLPGGNYELQIETLGDRSKGSLHQEGTAIAAAVIEAEALPFDPKHPGEQPLSFLALRDVFVPGVLLRPGLSFRGNGFQRTSVLSLETAVSFEGGFQIHSLIPVTWIESGSSGREAPRIGGSPWPELGVAYRVLGRPERYLGIGLSYLPDTDTTDQLSSAIQSQQLRVSLPARWSLGRWALDGSLFYGIHVPKHGVSVLGSTVDVDRRVTGAANLGLSYFGRDRWQVCAGLTAIRLTTQRVHGFFGTRITQSAGTLLQPQLSGAYRLARTTYVEAAMDWLSGGLLDENAESFVTWRVSLTHVL